MPELPEDHDHQQTQFKASETTVEVLTEDQTHVPSAEQPEGEHQQ